jgi:hypothetical protein
MDITNLTGFPVHHTYSENNTPRSEALSQTSSYASSLVERHRQSQADSRKPSVNWHG